MQNIFANTRRVHIRQWHIDLFSQALFFCWEYLLKIEAKMFAKQAKTFLKCSRISFSQIWQTLQQILLLEKSSSFADLLAKHNYMRKRYSIQEVFRRILVVFSAILNVLQSCEVFAIFLCKLFCKEIFVAKKFFIGI